MVLPDYKTLFIYLSKFYCAFPLLNWCLQGLMEWMRTNKLKLNLDMLEVLLVGSCSGLGTGCTLRLAGVVNSPKPSVYNLSVHLDMGLLLQ